MNRLKMSPSNGFASDDNRDTLFELTIVGQTF